MRVVKRFGRARSAAAELAIGLLAGALDEVRRVAPAGHGYGVRLSTATGAGSSAPATRSWENPGNRHRPPTPEAGLDREDRLAALSRLPLQRRTALRIHRQGQGRPARAGALAVLSAPIPNPRVRLPCPGASKPSAKGSHATLERTDRVRQHQDPAPHPHRIRVQISSSTHRDRDAQPRRTPTPSCPAEPNAQVSR
jgi:hypothetical protein